MDIAYVHAEKDSGQFMALVPGTCWDKIVDLATRHDFAIWAKDGNYVLVQGRDPAAVMRNLPFSIGYRAWNHVTRAVVDGRRCLDCPNQGTGCQGPGDKVPGCVDISERLRFASAAEQLAISVAESDDGCRGLVDYHPAPATMTAADISSLGLAITKSHIHLKPYAGAEQCKKIMSAVTAAGLDENSPVPEILYAAPAIHGIRGRRWGRRTSLSDLELDFNVYQINRITARVTAARGVEKKARDKEFRAGNCAGCVYDCQRPPRQYDSNCNVTRGSVVAGVELGAAERLWMQGFVVGDRDGRSDYPLGVGGRKVMGVIRGPSKSIPGAVDVVSTVPDYRFMGTMPYDDVERLAGCEPVTADSWFHAYAADNAGLDMRLVYWGLIQASQIRSSIYWYGDGRGKRNDVLSLTLEPRGRIVVGVDTSRGSGKRSPRFTFSLRYPYFTDFLNELHLMPGSGRNTW